MRKLRSSLPIVLGAVLLAAGLIGIVSGLPGDRAAEDDSAERAQSVTSPGNERLIQPATEPAAATQPASESLSGVERVQPGTPFDGERALAHAEAQMAFGPRPTGSEAHARAGDYILSELERAGWRTETQPFTYQGVQARNLIGRGQGGAGEGPVVILGAHYDTRRRADQDSIDPEAPVPGANDGASGVAILLELASVVDLDTMGGEVWLVFFDAEDNGRLDGWEWIVGSSYFAEHLTVDPAFVIVVDMVGDADLQLYYERNSDPYLRAQVWLVAREQGYADTFVTSERHAMLDDHTPFLQKGIPAADIIDFDYPYWHTTQDTVDKVSADSLERVGRTLQVFLEDGRWRAGS